MQSAVINPYTLSDRQASAPNVFVGNFYRLTDDSAAHSEYASQFLPGATLIVGHKFVQGEEGIISLRRSVWSSFPSQEHTIENITYTQKPSIKVGDTDYTTVEAILFGTLTTVSKNGEQQLVEWAARADCVTQNDIEWKVWRYQVYVNNKPRTAFKL